MMFMTKRLQSAALSTRSLINSRAAYFSTKGKDESAAAQDWGIKYDDEIYKF